MQWASEKRKRKKQSRGRTFSGDEIYHGYQRDACEQSLKRCQQQHDRTGDFETAVAFYESAISIAILEDMGFRIVEVVNPHTE